VAVVGDVTIPASAGLKTTIVADEDTAKKMVEDGQVDAAVIAEPGDPTGVRIIADTSAPVGVVQAFSLTPHVELLNPSSTPDFLAYLVALGFGLVFFISGMTFGTTIAQSVVEEKQTRVIEILLAAIPTRSLLAGKILGTSILAFAQIAILLAITVGGLTATGQGTLLEGLGVPFAWFAVFFVFGFILLASLFAATAAMVSRQEDIGSTTTPVTMLVMIPYFLVIFFNSNPTVVAILSYVPFSAPVGMPLRLFLGQAAWWEPLLSLALLIATTLLVILLGARIYENSLLKLGQRVRWREALTR
jgi:ABC-2 type transport system permease protein